MKKNYTTMTKDDKKKERTLRDLKKNRRNIWQSKED